MTELGEQEARQFFRTEAFVSAAQTTRDSGILALKPKALIDDYVFEPCGYSMNGIDGTGLITIHITPERGFSYASVEVSGFADDVSCPNELLASALRIFNPAKVAVALSVDDASACDRVGLLGTLSAVPGGYGCPSMTAPRLECGGAISFYNLACAKRYSSGSQGASSPRTTMHHCASFLSECQAESVGTPMEHTESDDVDNLSDPESTDALSQ